MTNATNAPNGPFVTVSVLNTALENFGKVFAAQLTAQIVVEIVSAINPMFENLNNHMDERFDEQDRRFEAHEKQFKQLFATEKIQDGRLDRLEL